MTPAFYITAKSLFTTLDVSDIYIGITATLPPKQYLHRHFAPTFTPTKQYQPSAFTDQLQIDYFPQIIPKERRRRLQ